MNSQKTAFITGANKGIGFEIARQLGHKGLRVFVGARDSGRGDAAISKLKSEGISASLVRVDVGSEASIRQAYEQVSKETDSLDVLINNAAILQDRSYDLLTVPDELLYDTYQINVFGALWVTRTFLPMMKKGSRIIMISSSAGSICHGASGYAPTYSSSKTALNGITLQLALSLSSRGIAVNAVCPGWVKTDMGGSSAPRSVSQGAETPVWLATEAPLSIHGKFYRDKKEIPW